MTKSNFYGILCNYFTGEQIDNLESYALEVAKDAHEGLDLSETYLHHIGRDFILSLLSDMTGDCDPIESISGISGGISIEGYEQMVRDMDAGTFGKI